MKQILIPVDFSENAQKAIVIAKQMADKTGAALTFLYVYTPYIGDLTTPASIPRMPVYEQLETDYRKTLAEYVDQARSEGFTAESIWRSDGIYTAIIETAKDILADLIVVGRTGKGGFLDKLIGSSATRIALDAPCPVLVVPMEMTHKVIEKIVFSTQFEASELHIAGEVKFIADSLGADLSLIHIGYTYEADREAEQEIIASWAERLKISPNHIVVRTSDGLGIEKGIDLFCEEQEADLLVVSTRKRDFLEQLLFNPSLTKEMLVHTHIPLLVYHVR
ncbi:universal stress protein [Dyadobacter tibetensis]|uniref:universal stress protein n=1 Tax=Dyadobacter tibetensis TaxID=1211851 RepID=UPI000470B981|nr:universal stress protein [Dyadobacter tibetensis]